MQQTIYTDLVAAGQPVGNHESDLYTPVNAVTIDLLRKHGIKTATTFRHQTTREFWFDIPFAFDPYWQARAR